MRYRTLGRTGLRVSELFLGTTTFGEDWGWGAGLDECRKLYAAYVEAGGNVIDTADKYTNADREGPALFHAEKSHGVPSAASTTRARSCRSRRSSPAVFVKS